jgi:CelD/BcsL family acetyltransferase involved in cellulose biosynthesis
MTGTAQPAALPTISVEPLQDLASEWIALWGQVPGATPFNHPAWQTVWLRHRGEESHAPASGPLFLAVRADAQLLGVAALDPGQRIATQTGDPNVSDYAFPLALPGLEHAVAAGIVEWLIEDLTAGLDLWGVPADCPMRRAFIAASERFGWTYAEEPESICPRVELPGDFEAYVASLPKKDRHELRRKLRNLHAAGEVSFESVTGAEAILARFDRFLELMRISRSDKDEFLTPEREAFFRDLAQTFGELGIARLGTLLLDGREAAMIFYFEDDTTSYLYNSGYAPEHSHLAVGLLSKALAIQDAIARGRKVFDFLRGEEEYKRRLGGVPRQLLTLRLRAR